MRVSACSHPTWEDTGDRYSSKSLFLLLVWEENCLPCPACSAGDLCAPFLVPLSALIPWAPAQPRSAVGEELAAFSPPEWRSEDEELYRFPSVEGPGPESVKPVLKNIKAVWVTEHQNMSVCEGEGKRCSAVQEAWAELQDVFSPDSVSMQLSGSSWRAKPCSRSSVCSGEGCPWKRSAGLKPRVQGKGGAEVTHRSEMV